MLLEWVGMWPTRQVTGVLGAESRPRMGSSLGAVHCPGYAPGTTAASWDLGSHLLQSETPLPHHMPPVRSPRQCEGFTTTTFLLTPSTLNRGIWNSRFTEQQQQQQKQRQKTSITMGPKKWFFQSCIWLNNKDTKGYVMNIAHNSPWFYPQKLYSLKSSILASVINHLI